MPDPSHAETAPRPKPSRRWYALAVVLMLGSAGLFTGVLLGKAAALRDRIEPMPRFVGPTGAQGFVVTVDEPGKQHIFYENRGSLDGRSFDTPRRQVWTTFDTPSMTCVVTRVGSDELVEVRLPGVGETTDKRVVTQDLVIAYDLPERQGHGAWVFDADAAGDYRIELAYVDAVRLDSGAVAIPPDLSRAEQQQRTAEQNTAYAAAQRDAIEQAALAELEPIDVLFAVGPDPTRGGFFELFGLKGAATVLAFGFTFSILIALVTFMLRNGHVTPRGELAAARRMGSSEHEA